MNLENYVKIMDIKDDFRYGDIVLYSHSDNPLDKMAKKTLKLENDKKFNQLKDKFQKRSEMTDDNNLKILKLEVDE